MSTRTSRVGRAFQQDARSWAHLTGSTYVSALSQLRSPYAQGLLGPRVLVRDLKGALEQHPLVGAEGGGHILGDDGFYATEPFAFNGQTDLIDLSLIVEALRIFTPIVGDQSQAVSSYSLKHTIERLLAPHVAYVSNGRLIWAAAASGLELTEPANGGPNLLIGISERQHDYIKRLITSGSNRPQAHHFRPGGLSHLVLALEQCAAGRTPQRWEAAASTATTPPFHVWLLQQVHWQSAIGDLARDYVAGFEASEHGAVESPSKLFAILAAAGASRDAEAAARSAVLAWAESLPVSSPVQLHLVGAVVQEVEGYGAGAGSIERYEYLCPCGAGEVVEEHDNIPGFREHQTWIDCSRCTSEWKLVEGRASRDWQLRRGRDGELAVGVSWDG